MGRTGYIAKYYQHFTSATHLWNPDITSVTILAVKPASKVTSRVFSPLSG